MGLEHVHARDAQAHDLCGANGGLAVGLIEHDRFGATTAMDVAAKLVALRGAPHRGNDTVANDESADVLSPRLFDKLLNQHVLTRALECLNDRFGGLDRFSKNNADALGALKQLDHNWNAANAFDGGQDVAPFPHEDGLRNANLVTTEHLQCAQLVALN